MSFKLLPAAAAAVGALALYSAAFTVTEVDQVIITEFGKPVGEPIKEAGLHFLNPFTQKVNRIERRLLEWDGPPVEMPTKDKTYISVDTFARWRIQDPKQFFLRLRDERSAQSRLEDILGSETRNAIARHELIEVVRSEPSRVVKEEVGGVGTLYPIKKGHHVIERDILKAAAPKLSEFGIELLDVRFKRVNYNATVQQRIYERMVSERKQIADRFRSEGAGEAARIRGKKERDLQKIESEAYRTIQEVRGQADAKAAEIYSRAYGQGPQAAEFYEFLKAMETYRLSLTDDTNLVLSTDSPLWRHLGAR
ncbi:MAG: protease modulator HflC [Deltaproteobacteria bacterium]|nr:protease modulator HflC [Deltaproteobacteria bacterium]